MESTPSGSDNDTLYVLPEDMRDALREDFGEVVVDDILLESISKADSLVTIGDVVTLFALENGIVPKLSIVDHVTQRDGDQDFKDRLAGFDEQMEIYVNNPAATITVKLWEEIEKASEGYEAVRIVVDGEEDLASLAAISLFPEGTTVIYGVPNRGAMVILVNEGIKQRINNILERMEA